MSINIKEIKRYNATIIIKVNYGSIDRIYEYNGQRYIGPLGIAHFIEHMMFYRKDTTYYQEFDGIGADVNAYTTQNETVYTVSANKNNIYEALGLLLEMLFSKPDISDELVQKEVSVISNEISQVNNKEINSLYCQLEQIKNNISKLTQECVDRFAIFDPGNEIYSNSPFQSKNKTACKIRIKDIKLNRTKDGLWFWTATGSYIKNDGSEGSLTKSFSTTKFK